MLRTLSLLSISRYRSASLCPRWMPGGDLLGGDLRVRLWALGELAARAFLSSDALGAGLLGATLPAGLAPAPGRCDPTRRYRKPSFLSPRGGEAGRAPAHGRCLLPQLSLPWASSAAVLPHQVNAYPSAAAAPSARLAALQSPDGNCYGRQRRPAGPWRRAR